MSVLIKNGRIVTAVDDYHADIYIEDEKISMIGKDLQVEAAKVIDASDRLVIPGGIDPHTHFDMPFGGTRSADDFESGPRAAAFGGTTCVIDFAIQSKGSSTFEGLDTWHQKADGKSLIDYAFHMIITDMPDSRLPEMQKLAEHARGKLSSAEIIDLRTLVPLDIETIEASVKKTGRCMIVHEATRTSGFGAELSALVQERCFYHLEAPIERVTGFDTPYPHSLEWAYFPGPVRIGQALKKIMKDA